MKRRSFLLNFGLASFGTIVLPYQTLGKESLLWKGDVICNSHVRHGNFSPLSRNSNSTLLFERKIDVSRDLFFKNGISENIGDLNTLKVKTGKELFIISFDKSQLWSNGISYDLPNDGASIEFFNKEKRIQVIQMGEIKSSSESCCILMEGTAMLGEDMLTKNEWGIIDKDNAICLKEKGMLFIIDL